MDTLELFTFVQDLASIANSKRHASQSIHFYDSKFKFTFYDK
jgi:hypothetical protein